MLLEKMITLQGANSLSKVFTQLASVKGKILLWQCPQEEEGRRRQHAKVGLLNLLQEEMTLYPARGEFGFRNHQCIYFLGFNRTTIFKAPILYHSPLKLVIRLPRQVMLINGREEGRGEPPENFLLHYSLNVGGGVYQQSRILDLSAQGLAFKSSFHNVIRFKKGDRLWLKTSGDETWTKEGEVRYVVPVRPLGEEGYFRVGIRTS